MVSNTQSPAPASMVDSLSAYEFQVQIDGQVVTGIFSVQGLTSFMAEDELPPLLITKMVQRDRNLPCSRWIQATQQASEGALPTKDVVIVALDEGAATRRWTYKQAHILQISYSDFNTALSELVEERILLRAAAVEVEWL